MWVLNPTVFITKDGEELSTESIANNDLVWVNKDLIYESDKISSSDISPIIKQLLALML